MSVPVVVPAIEPRELDYRKASVILSEFARTVLASDAKAGKVLTTLATHVAGLERFVNTAGPQLADIDDVVPLEEHENALQQIIELEIENRIQQRVLEATLDRLSAPAPKAVTQIEVPLGGTDTIPQDLPADPKPKKIKRSASAVKSAKKA